MAFIATPDTEVGNVFAGAGGSLRVTAILFGAHLCPVPIGGAHIAGDHGVLYIEPRGAYKYSRLSNSAPSADLAGAIDRFKYQVVDGSGMATVGNLDFPAGSEMASVPASAAPIFSDAQEADSASAFAWA
jgi:hypothetical protein